MASDATKAELSEAMDSMIEEVRLTEAPARISHTGSIQTLDEESHSGLDWRSVQLNFSSPSFFPKLFYHSK